MKQVASLVLKSNIQKFSNSPYQCSKSRNHKMNATHALCKQH